MSGILSVSEVKNGQEFRALRDEWNELVENDPHATVFQLWEFQFYAWKISSGSVSPCLATVRDETGKLVGCAPLGTQVWGVTPFSARILAFACGKACDYSDFILHKDYAEAALSALAEWFRENMWRWDVLTLRSVREDSRLIACPEQFLNRIGKPYQISPCNLAPYLRIQEGWSGYEDVLSSKSRIRDTRYEVRKLFRRFNGSFQEACNEPDLEEAANQLYGLHQKRWREKNQLGAFAKPLVQDEFRSLMKQLGERGIAKIHSIATKERTIVSLCTFEYRRNVYCYQTGFDADYSTLSPGRVMHALRITRAIESGAREYDFLYGDEDYKFGWANDKRNLYLIEVQTGSWRRLVYQQWNRIRMRLVQSERLRALYLKLRPPAPEKA